MQPDPGRAPSRARTDIHKICEAILAKRISQELGLLKKAEAGRSDNLTRSSCGCSRVRRSSLLSESQEQHILGPKPSGSVCRNIARWPHNTRALGRLLNPCIYWPCQGHQTAP